MLAIRSWRQVNIFREFGYYDKILGLLKIVGRGGGMDDLFIYMDIVEPDLFSEEKVMWKSLVEKLLSDILGLVLIEDDDLLLTEEGSAILKNHKSGDVGYNKQLIFLYLARSVGGFVNIFYSLRQGGKITKETIIERVNSEREKEGYPPRKRWRDFSDRLEWFKEMGIAKEYENDVFALTHIGMQLLMRMQKKEGDGAGGDDRTEDGSEEPVEAEVMEETPTTTLNQDPKGFQDRITGSIKNRRFGIRIDDDITVYIVGGDTLRVIEGRVLQHKSGLHLVDTDGYYHRISYDWVTDILIKRHNRPHPKDDKEYAKKKKKRKPSKPKESRSLNNAYV